MGHLGKDLALRAGTLQVRTLGVQLGQQLVPRPFQLGHLVLQLGSAGCLGPVCTHSCVMGVFGVRSETSRGWLLVVWRPVMGSFMRTHALDTPGNPDMLGQVTGHEHDGQPVCCQSCIICRGAAAPGKTCAAPSLT